MTNVKVLGSLNKFQANVLPSFADGVAGAVVVSLPWSTSATGLLIALWLCAVLPTLDFVVLRRQALSAHGGLPVLLAAMGIVGMFWADVTIYDRISGVGPFIRLAAIPVLFAQFRRSDRGGWIGPAFLISATVLLTVSYAMVLFPSYNIFPGRGIGVPVKDHITQSGLFLICAVGLLDVVVSEWNERGALVSLACTTLALLFIGNIFYVSTSRTTLIVLPFLLLLFAQRCGMFRVSVTKMASFLVVGGAICFAVWSTSSYVQGRILNVFKEIAEYQETGIDTSSGSRLAFWKDSIAIICEAPVFGHGTGSIAEEFRRHLDQGAGSSATNPHNQVFAVAVQVGACGIVLLVMMWWAHWRLFYRPGTAAWIGLIAVSQNIVSSLFNSHLMDFTQSWFYVFAVGIYGGCVLREKGETTRRSTLPLQQAKTK